MNRTLIRISGDDRESFLQGLITNDIAKAGPDCLVYSALLTPQGKYIADFFALAFPDAYVLDVATSRAAKLAQRLSMYRLRANVEIEESSMSVTTGIDGGLTDPRHSALPLRSYGTLDTSTCPDPLDLRLDHIIPEADLELTDDSFILEYGFERLNGVDFKKGCYVGQEVTARMKHKTELKKGLVGLSISGTATHGDQIISSEKPAGTLLSHDSTRALAHMRFDRMSDEMHAGSAVLSPR